MKIGIRLSTLVFVSLTGCTGQVTPKTVATVTSDVTIGLKAAMCILETVSTDEKIGMSEKEAIAAAVATCGLQAFTDGEQQARAVLESHRKSEVTEGLTAIAPVSK